MPVERQALAALLAVALPLASLAAEPTPVPPPARPLTVADAELLEFLGEFDDAKGEFVDPFVIDAVSTVVADAEREAKRAAKRKARSEAPPVPSPAPPPATPSETPP